jgi:AmmeMemoRadiSam system protein B
MIERGTVRPSALAGRWYPGDVATLRATVAGHLSPRHAVGHVAFVVAPHAGIMYSGATAGHAWSVVPDARRIVMVGPAHRVAISGVAIGDFAAFRIPGVDMAVDRAALVDLEATLPDLVSFVPGAHDAEHCLEIQLPFAAARLPGVPIVPLLAGAIGPDDLAKVLAHVLKPDDVLVVSSDLSHFQPYDDARRRDLATLQAIVDLSTDALRGDDACGYRGIGACASLARARGYRGVVLDYSSSGDTGGDREAVVGYGAVAFGALA